jgi:hypothetical protein
MEESKPSAEFGGTNGKGIPSNGCLFFLPHLNTCQDSQMLKKTQINTNASQRDGIVLIPYLISLWNYCTYGYTFALFWFITIPSQGNGE